MNTENNINNTNKKQENQKYKSQINSFFYNSSNYNSTNQTLNTKPDNIENINRKIIKQNYNDFNISNDFQIRNMTDESDFHRGLYTNDSKKISNNKNKTFSTNNNIKNNNYISNNKMTPNNKNIKKNKLHSNLEYLSSIKVQSNKKNIFDKKIHSNNSKINNKNNNNFFGNNHIDKIFKSTNDYTPSPIYNNKKLLENEENMLEDQLVQKSSKSTFHNIEIAKDDKLDNYNNFYDNKNTLFKYSDNNNQFNQYNEQLSNIKLNKNINYNQNQQLGYFYNSTFSNSSKNKKMKETNKNISNFNNNFNDNNELSEMLDQEYLTDNYNSLSNGFLQKKKFGKEQYLNLFINKSQNFANIAKKKNKSLGLIRGLKTNNSTLNNIIQNHRPSTPSCVYSFKPKNLSNYNQEYFEAHGNK